jgi:hypothetical protein
VACPFGRSTWGACAEPAEQEGGAISGRSDAANEELLMVDPKSSARDSARWTDSDNLWLDHVTLIDEDLSWLAAVRWVTFWNVKFPAGFLSRRSPRNFGSQLTLGRHWSLRLPLLA